MSDPTEDTKNTVPCNDCAGDGWWVQEIGGCGEDGENDTRESVQVQCEKCRGSGRMPI